VQREEEHRRIGRDRVAAPAEREPVHEEDRQRRRERKRDRRDHDQRARIAHAEERGEAKERRDDRVGDERVPHVPRAVLVPRRGAERGAQHLHFIAGQEAAVVMRQPQLDHADNCRERCPHRAYQTTS
jgi:hypothetical protein